MPIATKPSTGPKPRPKAMATTRKAPAIRVGPTRTVLVGRYLLGVGLIAAAFLVVPQLGLPTWLGWTLGGVGFVAGNLVRPLYRAQVRPRDESFVTTLEIVNFLLVGLAIAIIAMVLSQFSSDAVIRALLDWKVLSGSVAFFALMGLRDLMHRWRQA